MAVFNFLQLRRGFSRVAGVEEFERTKEAADAVCAVMGRHKGLVSIGRHADQIRTLRRERAPAWGATGTPG